MERISLNKEQSLKSIILDGLRYQEYSLVAKTFSDNPIYLYHNAARHAIAIYNCKRSYDDLILFDTRKPAKVNLIIKEYKRYNDDEFREIAEKLAHLIGGDMPKEEKVVYISKL